MKQNYSKSIPIPIMSSRSDLWGYSHACGGIHEGITKVFSESSLYIFNIVQQPMKKSCTVSFVEPGLEFLEGDLATTVGIYTIKRELKSISKPSFPMVILLWYSG